MAILSALPLDLINLISPALLVPLPSSICSTAPGEPSPSPIVP
jgi:hypothetical protein